MKRGTPKHPKVFALCKALKVRRPTAIGYLELLWHATAEFTPQGNIGKYPDEWIEACLDWHGKRSKLIRALLATRWLDASDTWRLLVHDWSDHADDSVRKRLNRNSLSILSLSEKVTGQSSVSDRISSDHGSPALACALASAMPQPQPRPPEYVGPRLLAADLNGQTSQRFEEFWSRYPKQTWRDSAARDWCSVVTVESEPAVFACFENYLASAEVARRAVMNAGSNEHTVGWIMKCHHDGWASRWPKACAPERKLSVTEQAEANWMRDHPGETI